jgi:hypothetical protein
MLIFSVRLIAPKRTQLSGFASFNPNGVSDKTIAKVVKK